MQRPLFLTVMSTYFYHFESQFTELTLQSPTMPIDGDAWATYYDNETNKIWLLSPQQCQPCDYVDNVITYNIDENVFENKTPIANHTLAMNGIISRYAVAIGDEIYFNGDGGNIDKYNVKTGKTTNLLYHDTRHRCLVADDRFLFIIAGMFIAGIGSWHGFSIYDTFNNQLHMGSDLPLYLRYLSCELINCTIYTFGGSNGSPVSAIFKVEIGTGDDVLNNLQNEWSQIGSLNVERAMHNSVRCNNVDNNLIYIIGGMNATKNPNPLPELSIEIFDINTETVETATFTLNEARLNPAVICIDQHIYIFGGRTSWAGSTLYSWEKSNELYSSSPSTSPTTGPTETTAVPSYNPTTDEPTYNPSTGPSTHPSKVPSNMPSSVLTSDYIYTDYTSTETPITSSEINSVSISETSVVSTEVTVADIETSGRDVVMTALITAIIVLTCICITVLIYIMNYFGIAKLKQMIQRTVVRNVVRLASNGMSERNLTKTVQHLQTAPIGNVVTVTGTNDNKEHHLQSATMGNVELALASVITTPDQGDIVERRTVEGMGEAVSYLKYVECGETPKENLTVEGDEMDFADVANNSTKGYAYTDDGAQI